MVTKFVSLLMLVSTLLSNIFGFAIPAVPKNGVQSENKPEISEYNVCDEVHGVRDSVFYIILLSCINLY